MAGQVTMQTIYRELKSLRIDIEAVKHALIPLETVSAREFKEIRKTKKEMESGKKSP